MPNKMFDRVFFNNLVDVFRSPIRYVFFSFDKWSFVRNWMTAIIKVKLAVKRDGRTKGLISRWMKSGHIWIELRVNSTNVGNRLNTALTRIEFKFQRQFPILFDGNVWPENPKVVRKKNVPKLLGNRSLFFSLNSNEFVPYKRMFTKIAHNSMENIRISQISHENISDI